MARNNTPRIAVGGILTECNHFGGVAIDMETYQRTELRRDEQVLASSTSVVGGMLEGLRTGNAAAIPLLYASACAGGPIEKSCYDLLRTELLERLRAALPVDGVLMPIHGAALAEGLDDPEGDMIHAVRDIVGDAVPIVATLDLHAHVTQEMVQYADALLGWETYPHSDQYGTGQRAAALMLASVTRQVRPTMVMAKVPVITSAVHGSTEGEDPFADLMRFTKSLESRTGVLSTSLFLIHPYMDVAGMGSGGLVVTDADADLARELATQIARQYWDRRNDLEPELLTPSAAIKRGDELAGKPIILVETADCCGGGAAGDSIHTLSALVDASVSEPALVIVVDPQAAAKCHEAGTGADLDLRLGHQLDSRWGNPRTFSGRVAKLSDGRFTYTGGQWEGLPAEMGPSAVFQIGSVSVLITSCATYDWADEQFQSVGLDAKSAKFVVAKNPMNYRLAYGDFAEAVYLLDTPGPTPATLRHVTFEHLQRPYFPADAEIPGLQPTILTRTH